MEKLRGVLNKLKEKTNENTRTNIIIVIAALAVLLILLSDSFTSCPSKNGGSEEPAGTRVSVSAQDYAEQLEEKLSGILSSVNGAGEVKVMVTLQNGPEYIYASADKSSVNTSASQDNNGRHSTDERENTESNYIIIKTDKGEEALKRTELMPAVNGVVVVCSGADDPRVYESVMNVVTTVLNVSSKRVCITKSID